ncbi:MAG: hypothetical protein KAW56_00330 [Candidatus Marinimicrobia bacterium]|nr:hypothetical protein [Candidatus Neomarinimicrobiota bacterium]MCK4445506.1 hypothetical protein [Candidatus Neomarinimicrobiota bacterium]
MKKYEINAVFEHDIINVLKSLEIYENILSGKFHCSFCNKVITIENIHSIFPEDENIMFCCNDSECIKCVS